MPRPLLLLAVLATAVLHAAPATHAQSARMSPHLPMGHDRASGQTHTGAPADARVDAHPVRLRAALTEGFDDIRTLPADGWSLQNLSDPLGYIESWIQGAGAGFPAHEGAPDAFIAANYSNTDDIGTISNWLMTPEVVIGNGTVLTFWTRTRSGPVQYPDRLEVRMSTSGASTDAGMTATSVGDFTTLLLTINPDLSNDPTAYPQEWTEYTATVSGLAAPTTGRFAFRYFVTDAGPAGTNSNYIGIDEVSVDSNIDGVYLAARPSQIDFDTLAIGTPGASQTVTLTNIGNATLTISSIDFEGASGVTLNTTSMALTLAAGESTTLSVEASTAAEGSLDGTIAIAHNGPSSPTVIEVTGTVIDVELRSYCSGTMLTFDPTTAGPANVYPSTVAVNGLAAGEEIFAVMVRLMGVSHTKPRDMGVRIEHPLGSFTTLTQSPGGTTPAVDVDLTFMDGLPPIVEPMTTGTYGPTINNWATFPPPAPTENGSTLTGFAEVHPGGTWKLYAFDMLAGDGGSIDEFCVDLLVIPPSGGPGEPGDPLTYTSTNAPLPVPSGGECQEPGAPAVSTIVVSGVSGVVADVDVVVDILATWIGTVEATLSHSGLSMLVIDNPGATSPTGCGNSTANYPGIVLDDDATNSVQSGPFPLVAGASYQPANPLSAFNGMSINGDWTLSVTDGGENYITTFEGWALIITPGGTIDTEAETPTALSRLVVAPNPVSADGRVTLTVATSQDVRVVLYDALGREVAVLLERSMTAGQQAHIGFRTAGLAPGVYVVRASGTDLSLTERITVVR